MTSKVQVSFARTRVDDNNVSREQVRFTSVETEGLNPGEFLEHTMTVTTTATALPDAGNVSRPRNMTIFNDGPSAVRIGISASFFGGSANDVLAQMEIPVGEFLHIPKYSPNDFLAIVPFQVETTTGTSRIRIYSEELKDT